MMMDDLLRHSMTSLAIQCGIACLVENLTHADSIPSVRIICSTLTSSYSTREKWSREHSEREAQVQASAIPSSGIWNKLVGLDQS